mmetsp:Transcript_10862/g.36009  ORF Transcript_10862/g.36009 Transcript_10862/m.36009 type:complete len:149 (+) Transcript_10862:409-855(+)
MLVATTASGDVEYANRAAAASLGYDDHDDVVGTSFFALLADESRLRFQSALQAVMSQKQARATLAFEKPLEIKKRVSPPPRKGSGGGNNSKCAKTEHDDDDGRQQKTLVVDLVAHCEKKADASSVEWSVVCAARPLPLQQASPSPAVS